jgi:hypothetical protein
MGGAFLQTLQERRDPLDLRSQVLDSPTQSRRQYTYAVDSKNNITMPQVAPFKAKLEVQDTLDGQRLRCAGFLRALRLLPTELTTVKNAVTVP